uniref:Perlucin-like protein isoform X1 n=1 Tax=Crassostrea virginica TaxID=6565 RepID=A0A8B8BX59_CRAVI|nr:perlucin-like protein isoform X1 [Crassostrea virginica]
MATSCRVFLLSAFLLCAYAQNDGILKKQLSDLHYQLFKSVQNKTSLVKMIAFETQCNLNGCSFNGCNDEDSNTCENQLMKKLTQIQKSVDSLNNAKNLTKGCKSGWKAYGGHCYLYIKTPHNWFEAQMKCREFGGTLVQIDSKEENDWLLKTLPKERSWLDHTDVGTEGTWKLFSTGRSPTFTNWSKGQPDNRGNQDCACNYYNRKTGAWDDVTCSYKLGFICEISDS